MRLISTGNHRKELELSQVQLEAMAVRSTALLLLIGLCLCSALTKPKFIVIGAGAYTLAGALTLAVVDHTSTLSVALILIFYGLLCCA